MAIGAVQTILAESWLNGERHLLRRFQSAFRSTVLETCLTISDSIFRLYFIKHALLFRLLGLVGLLGLFLGPFSGSDNVT